jgi:diguanylate cyclase (GGDEF)-like protein
MQAASTRTVNRTDHPVFLDLLENSVVEAKRSRETLGLLILKLRNLGRLNSSFGYRGGDSILSSVASRLHSELGGRAQVVRIGASRFAVILSRLKDSTHAQLAGHKIERMFSAPMLIESREVMLNVVQGIALYPEHADSASKLMLRAETAMNHALKQGVSLFVCDEADASQDEDSVRIESFLATLLQAGRVETYYQPQVSIRSGKPIGAEALLRCRDDSGDFISPEVVVEAAERMHLLTDITYVIMNAALRNCVEWRQFMPKPNVSVNVSLSTLLDPDFVDSVVSILGLWGAEPGNLTIEITESNFMSDPDRSFAVMSELKDMGISVAVDDFGTGYSSLSYFKSIPARELKIDRSFVMNMVQDLVDQKLVRTVINLAHEFDLKVVAEGVEDEASLQMLKQFGCDIAQGYFFGRPMPAAQFQTWLQAHSRPHEIRGTDL